MTEESIQFHTGQTITSGPLRLSDLLRQDARRHIKQHDAAREIRSIKLGTY